MDIVGYVISYPEELESRRYTSKATWVRLTQSMMQERPGNMIRIEPVSYVPDWSRK